MRVAPVRRSIDSTYESKQTQIVTVCVCAKTSGLGSVRQHLSAGVYGGRHMACMGGPAHQLAVHKSGGLQISVTLVA